jgi:hypothetical protein
MLRVAQGSGQVRSGDELASCQFLKFSVNQGTDTPVPVPVPVPDLSGDGDGASVPDFAGGGDAPPSPSPIC